MQAGIMSTAQTRNERSSDQMFVEVYERLKAMASRSLSGARGGTLNTTALVHELYLRIGNEHAFKFEHTGQFFSYAARAIRHLLIDRARARLSQRAGGQWQRLPLDASDEPPAEENTDPATPTPETPRLAFEPENLEEIFESAEQLLELDDALRALAKLDARAAEVVELRCFAGLTAEQAAEALAIGKRTCDRDWTFALSFLRAELG
jgi:RNA polymerase sigma factor (sigma-70 family)